MTSQPRAEILKYICLANLPGSHSGLVSSSPVERLITPSGDRLKKFHVSAFTTDK